MIVADEFSLPVGMEDAFDALVEPGLVLASVSGAKQTGRVDDRTSRGELRLEVGWTLIPYRGVVRVEERDREAGALRLSLDAREGRGKGTARGEVEIRLRESGGTTRVAVRSDLQLEGRAERAGQAAVEAALGSLIAELAAGLADRLASRVGKATTGVAGGAPAAEAPTRPPGDGPSVSEAPSAPTPARQPEPEVVIPGRVQIMTTEPVPAASVAPRDSLAETLAARPWLVPLVAAALLLLLVAAARRRRG